MTIGDELLRGERGGGKGGRVSFYSFRVCSNRINKNFFDINCKSFDDESVNLSTVFALSLSLSLSHSIIENLISSSLSSLTSISITMIEL